MKRRVTTAALCAMVCIALSGFVGCTPPPNKNEQAQTSETLAMETLAQSQALTETIGQEAIGIIEAEEADASSALVGQSDSVAGSAETAGNSDADAGASRAPSIDDFTVKDLRIDDSKEEKVAD